MNHPVPWVALPWLILAANPGGAASSGALDLNALVGGGAGATLVAIIIYVGRLILDKAIPSRSDARANVTILLEGMQSMVKALQTERDADAARLKERQQRIDQLEQSSESDYKKKAELQAEVIELRAAVARKDRHIRQLVSMLVQLGAKVMGLDSDNLEITLPADQVEQIRKDAGLTA